MLMCLLSTLLFFLRLEADNQLYVSYKLIGKNRIAVPTHYFKVILGETKNNQLEMQSYILPNQAINEKTPLHMFQVPVETIERASGLIFFDTVPRHAIKQIWPTIPPSADKKMKKRKFKQNQLGVV
ncbi:hypothetical protein OS493_018355 [Desmophyllum pertusum]|uniref:DNA/RNA non-specific endonuclease/pyrophosphatase/phosphodiesterase domain-containing protein n=1 Tax=Desmophyllum pertusum TaxID=174260 RepID=A0A9W9YC18_9CNID|nr:hypothetical protein OS493_018355 [Desmophyllum pertusum]